MNALTFCCLTLSALLLPAIMPMYADELPDKAFGESGFNSEALIGILYDFKLTQTRVPTKVSSGDYIAILDEFISGSWSEGYPNKYFRATRAVYATQLFIPVMSAAAAPKAFGVGDVVSPSMWMVHYKGQVLPPRPGTFRFVGYADDVMAVAVNGRTVLVGGRADTLNNFKRVTWKSTEGKGMAAGNGDLTYGDWLELDTRTPIDLDILVGERPGASFAAFLLYQEKGATYEQAGGHPVLPVFQLAPGPLPAKGSALPTAPGSAPWRGIP